LPPHATRLLALLGAYGTRELARRSPPAAPLGAPPNPSGVRTVLRRRLPARPCGRVASLRRRYVPHRRSDTDSSRQHCRALSGHWLVGVGAAVEAAERHHRSSLICAGWVFSFRRHSDCPPHATATPNAVAGTRRSTVRAMSQVKPMGSRPTAVITRFCGSSPSWPAFDAAGASASGAPSDLGDRRVEACLAGAQGAADGRAEANTSTRSASGSGMRHPHRRRLGGATAPSQLERIPAVGLHAIAGLPCQAARSRWGRLRSRHANSSAGPSLRTSRLHHPDPRNPTATARTQAALRLTLPDRPGVRDREGPLP